MMDKPTEFDYLLNRMEHAGQQETPAEHHYGTHRTSLLRHVRALEKNAERYRWLRDDPPLTLSARRFPGETEAGCYLDGHTLDAAVDAAILAATAAGAA